MSLKFDTTKLDAVIARLQALEKKEVEWGFFENSVYPSSHPNPEAAGKPVAQIAAFNEWGSPLAPARPFFTLHIIRVFPLYNGQKKLPKVSPQLEHIASNTVLGRGTTVAFRTLGKALVQDLKDKIEDYGSDPGDPYPHNSKHWQEVKGFDDPLKQTGTMIDSVEYRVK